MEREELCTIALELIHTDPDQPRQQFIHKDLVDLAQSIKENGLLQAITVRHHPDNLGHFIIIAGERRYRASKMNDAEAIACIIKSDKTKHGYFALSLIENLHRVDLNPIDEAETYHKLLNQHGKTMAEVCVIAQKSSCTIDTRLSLLKLPREIQDMIRKDELPKTSALSLQQYKTIFKVSDRELIALANRLIDGDETANLELMAVEVAKDKIGRNHKDSPAKILKKILEFCSHGTTIDRLIDEFNLLAPNDQSKAWSAIHPRFRNNILKRLDEINRATKKATTLLTSVEKYTALSRVYTTLKGMLYDDTGKIQVNMSRRNFANLYHINDANPQLEKNFNSVLRVLRSYWYREIQSESDSMEREFIKFIDKLKQDFKTNSFDELVVILREKAGHLAVPITL